MERAAKILLTIDLFIYIACIVTFFMAFIGIVNFYTPLILALISVAIFIMVVKLGNRKTNQSKPSSNHN